MDDVSVVARRARRAGELGKLRLAAGILPGGAARELGLAMLAPEPALAGGLAGGVGAAVFALRWWRRSSDAAATDGLLVGEPVRWPVRSHVAACPAPATGGAASHASRSAWRPRFSLGW